MRSLLWQPRPSITTPAFSAGDHGAPHTSQLHTCHVSRVSTPALTNGSAISQSGGLWLKLPFKMKVQIT